MKNMKNIVFVVSMSLSACTFALGPRIDPSSVKLEQKARAEVATIEYVLEDAPGIVTVDIETNAVANAAVDDPGWVSIGGENVQCIDGDVNKYVADLGKHVLTWRVFEGWPGQKVPRGCARAVVTAWATNAPPDYLVVDMIESNHVRYYTSTNFLPNGGLTNVYYKRDAIVMRKIPGQAVEWKMGSAVGTQNHSANQEQHDVILTNDYYMGVFMLTQGQIRKFAPYSWNSGNPKYDLPNGQRAFQYGNIACEGYEEPTNTSPCCSTQWTFMRGAVADYDWPVNRHKVSTDSWLGKLRAKTGVDFDLPTDAQWEFACRAGTTTVLYNGDFTSSNFSTYLNPIAWYNSNRGGYMWHPVGFKLPNAFGLYDMIGNGREMCLDRYAADYGGIANKYEPEGPINTNDRVYRSNVPNYNWDGMGSAIRYNAGNTYYGTRLVCPVTLKYPESEK